MKLYRVIDKQTSIFIRDDFTFNEETEIGLDVQPAHGLYQPKWNGTEWVEGLSAEEIATAISTPSIEELKQSLSSTDYKIIKCYEYQLAGLSLPYDIIALHEERQSLRDQINAMEQDIENLQFSE